jgi:predicted NBD/HSP70 family sugar kinase
MYILFDIGGTNTRVAKSNGQSLGEIKKFATFQNFDDGTKAIVDAAKELSAGQEIQGAVGGIREVLDKGKTKLVTDPRSSVIPDWVEKPLKETLEKELNCQVYLENDASMQALGEATYGAGKDQEIVAFFTISTGFGGARVVNKKIDEKAVGFEPGDLIVGFTDKPIYIENLISGGALEKKYGKAPTEIDDPRVWEFVEQYLSFGLYDVIALWSPHMIVLGGPVATKISFEKLKENLKKISRKYLVLPEVVEAKLGDQAGLYGALSYLHSRFVEKVT